MVANMHASPLMTRPAGWLDQMQSAGAWILPDAVFDGDTLRSGCAVFLKDGRAQIAPAADLPQVGQGGEIWRTSGIVSPGFFDLQVNGGGGVLFNSDPTEAGLRSIAQAHRSTGTAGFLPTVITDRADVMEAAAAAVINTLGQDGIAGIHIEGPHISLARRGTHAAEYIRPLDARTLATLAKLRGCDVPVMITLAPEAVTPGQIRALVGQGVIVALGHSDATASQTRAALSEGAQTFTHLFNAMSPMQNREAGRYRCRHKFHGLLLDDL